MRRAYWATIQPSPSTPTAAISTDSGAAAPAPLPDAFIPTSNGTRKAMENTGPITPTDCAIASTRVSDPPRR
jgi:hypothetical protein